MNCRLPGSLIRERRGEWGTPPTDGLGSHLPCECGCRRIGSGTPCRRESAGCFERLAFLFRGIADQASSLISNRRNAVWRRAVQLTSSSATTGGPLVRRRDSNFEMGASTPDRTATRRTAATFGNYAVSRRVAPRSVQAYESTGRILHGY
jgi:hypothetical protein